MFLLNKEANQRNEDDIIEIGCGIHYFLTSF